MSQVSTVLVDDTLEKSGEKNGKPWTRYGLKDGNGDWYSTFQSGIVLPELKGRKVEIEWEQNGDFRNLLRASPIETPPAPGTGDYIKGKEAPSTQRSIHASVALEQANTWLTHLPEAERSVLSEQAVILVANKFFQWLTDRAEGKETGTTPPPSSDVPV